MWTFLCKDCQSKSFVATKGSQKGKLNVPCKASRNVLLRVSESNQHSNFSQIEAECLDRRQILLSFASLSFLLPPLASHAQDSISEVQIRQTVFQVFDKTAGKSKAPVLLRLVFHDSGTFSEKSKNGGANASVRFELKRPENSGLNRGWKVIEQTMQELKGTLAEGKVSHADLIALGGAYAVAVTTGPKIDVKIGREDASSEDPQGRLPLETATADELLQVFEDKGFSTRDFVALSGSHTLGNKGFGEPLIFDNAYYTALLEKPWLDPNNKMASMIGLPSDHVLSDSQACLPYIKEYAEDKQKFYKDFKSAYLKLTSLGTQFA